MGKWGREVSAQMFSPRDRKGWTFLLCICVSMYAAAKKLPELEMKVGCVPCVSSASKHWCCSEDIQTALQYCTQDHEMLLV